MRARSRGGQDAGRRTGPAEWSVGRLFAASSARRLRPHRILLALALTGCAPHRAPDLVDRVPSSVPPPSSAVVAADAAPVSEAPSTETAAASTTPSASSSQAESDEALIRAFVALEREEAQPTEIRQFVAQHPELLVAEAKPYGRALMWALEREQAEAALALIRAGAAVTGPKPGAAGPLHAAAAGGLDAVVKELLARGAVATADDYWGTPLHFAAKRGHASTMKLLLQAGAEPNAHAQDHAFTPLHGAVIERHLDAIRVLIAAKADLEAKDDDGQTPLHWAGYAYVPQAVHLYADIGQPHDTVFRDPGPAVAMKLLLDAGARIDALDDRGNTPLHAAAAVGSLRGAEMLVRHGARRDVDNHAGQTPLELAKNHQDEELERLLSTGR